MPPLPTGGEPAGSPQPPHTRKRNNETEFLSVRYIYSIFGSDVNAFFAATLQSGTQGGNGLEFSEKTISERMFGKRRASFSIIGSIGGSNRNAAQLASRGVGFRMA
ncbi:Hypothetical protein AT6N2_L1705 [Agrobacterium tumefaciens]|nr:Hypothetical protein AT6N2_L1705 [Agrobacterium tumefaciens]